MSDSKLLVFKPMSLIKEHIRHALEADKHATTQADDTPAAALILSRTLHSGVMLASNGRPLQLKPVCPLGLYPATNQNWFSKTFEMFGNVTFMETLPLTDGRGENLLEAPDHAEFVLSITDDQVELTILA